MSDRCHDCEHYVHLMDASMFGRGALKDDTWRIGVEWVNPEEGEFDINPGVLFCHKEKLLTSRPRIGAVEFGPYRQERTGCGANGNLSSNTHSASPEKAGKVTAILMKDVAEAQFYVAIDDAPVREYEVELKVVLERRDSFGVKYELSTIKMSHQFPVIALHHVTQIFESQGETIDTFYDSTKLERYTSRRELSRSTSTWYDFDWEARRRRRVV